MVAALIAALFCGVNESWQPLDLADANHIPERHPARAASSWHEQGPGTWMGPSHPQVLGELRGPSG